MTTSDEMVSIRVVEKETGIAKDVLRVWEKRYGYPLPERTELGERLYARNQIERLKVIKKLVDSGMRPGKVVAFGDSELAALAEKTPDKTTAPLERTEDIAVAMAMLTGNNSTQLRDFLQTKLVTMGARNFVIDFMAPMNHAVGEAWFSGRIQLFNEHYYTYQIKSVLLSAFAMARIEAKPPRVLLATIHGEMHVLGLLMAEFILTLEGATCITLGPQVPYQDLVRSAEFYAADIVALSFSSIYPKKDIQRILSKLANDLPQTTEIWAGGDSVHKIDIAAPKSVFSPVLTRSRRR